MKKTYLLFMVGLMLTAFALPAFAAPAGGKPMPPQQAEQPMMPEQQAKAKAIIEEYETKMMPMQDKLWGKFLELRVLGTVAGVTRDDIAIVIDDIISLRAQIRAEHVNLGKAFEKAGLPPAKGYHRMGMMGGGHMGMMGPGMEVPCNGAGYGPCPGAMMMDGRGPCPKGGPHHGGPKPPRVGE